MITIRPAGTMPAETTIERPLDHLAACHRRIEERLRTFQRAGEHLPQRPDEALDAIESAMRFMDTSGALHTEDEERSLFPRMRDSLSEKVSAYLAALESQHREAESLYAELKQIATDLRGGCTAERIACYQSRAAQFAEIYRAHIQSEEEVLLRLGRELLSEPELAEISKEMRARRTR